MIYRPLLRAPYRHGFLMEPDLKRYYHDHPVRQLQARGQDLDVGDTIMVLWLGLYNVASITHTITPDAGQPYRIAELQHVIALDRPMQTFIVKPDQLYRLGGGPKLAAANLYPWLARADHPVPRWIGGRDVRAAMDDAACFERANPRLRVLRRWTTHPAMTVREDVLGMTA
jgi:hypothetical protein